jgi:predicted ATPase
MSLLKSVRIRNFKAIRDSGFVRLRDFTVFIGNNGSGKSSLLEALETYQTVLRDGLGKAAGRWKGFEHVRNQAVRKRNLRTKEGRDYVSEGIRFYTRLAAVPGKSIHLHFHAVSDGNRLFIHSEKQKLDQFVVARDSKGFVSLPTGAKSLVPLADGVSMISPTPSVHDVTRFDPTPAANAILDWQFLLLEPEHMGDPWPQQRTGGRVRLRKDGLNVADYLRDISETPGSGTKTLGEIIAAMKFVLPYATELRTRITSEVERAVYLQSREQGLSTEIPGWLLSTGTLRAVALLALLKDPNGPRTIFVEEIENGLDPRTVTLLVDEIRAATAKGHKQVIATTHSPFLLDLLDLGDIVLVERDETNSPRFSRPGDDETLSVWRKQFLPGRLYTMGRLRTQGRATRPKQNVKPEVPEGGWGDD